MSALRRGRMLEWRRYRAVDRQQRRVARIWSARGAPGGGCSESPQIQKAWVAFAGTTESSIRGPPPEVRSHPSQTAQIIAVEI